MGNLGKAFFPFAIVILAVSSLTAIYPTYAQTTPKPSTPEFTIQYVAYPYDVPTTYSTDPYTGQTITHPGYHVENKTRVLMVKNQPFTSYISNGSEVNLYYQVRVKGHFVNDDWYLQFGSPSEYPKQSGSEYTMISPRLYSSTSRGFQNGDQWDIQVKALIGSVIFVNGRLWGANDYYVFDGVDGDWSSTQTVTVNLPTPSSPISSPAPTISALPSQSPTSTPIQSGPQTVAFLGLDWLQVATVALLGIIAVLLVFVVVFLRKRSVKSPE